MGPVSVHGRERESGHVGRIDGLYEVCGLALNVPLLTLQHLSATSGQVGRIDESPRHIETHTKTPM